MTLYQGGPQDGLMDGLVDLGVIKFGDFTLVSGQKSSVYIDLRLLISKPPLLVFAADAYGAIVASLQEGRVTADRLAAVPYAALPIATAVSLRTGMPMIYTRKEVKAHGLGKEVEGLWESGERIIIIEDLITTGGSIIDCAKRLRGLGMIVEDAVFLIDRDQGGMENLAAAGIRGHAIFTLSAIQLARWAELREVQP